MAATQAPGSPASRAVTSAARGEIPRPDAQRSTPARDRTRRQGRHGFRGNAERKVVVACDGGGIDEVVAEIGEVGAPAAPRHEPWSPPFGGTDSASEALAASGTMVAGAVEELATVVEKLIELASRGWTQLPGPEAKRVVQILERGSRASAAIQSGALVAVEASEQWVKDGNRNVNEW